MNDDSKKPEAGASSPQAGKAAPGGASGGSQGFGPGAGPGAASYRETAAEATEGSGAAEAAADLSAEVDKLEGQIKDLTDRLLRAHADIDNLRKRAEREREETARYAISKFAIDIVGMTDNFQRAISAVPAEAAANDPALQTLLDGVMMTENEFLKVLEKHGVKRIDPMGELFNPHFHQAVMEQQNPTVPAGSVVQVLQPGYQIADRVIRPAMVIVARGGAKAGKAPGAEA